MLLAHVGKRDEAKAILSQALPVLNSAPEPYHHDAALAREAWDGIENVRATATTDRGMTRSKPGAK